MTDIVGMLDRLQNKALRDEELKNKILDTEKSETPIGDFCRICREQGFEIYDMDLICAGEDFHAAMKRSTNGGGENSPKLAGQDDFYELFLAALKK